MRKASEILGKHCYIVVNADPTNEMSENFPISTNIFPDPKTGKIKPHFFPYKLKK